MTAILDPSPPSWAATIWHDGRNLYLRLPDSGYITKLVFTEAGLSKGLKLVRNYAKAPNGHVAPQPAPKVPRRKPFRPSEEAQAAMAEAVRKLKT